MHNDKSAKRGAPPHRRGTEGEVLSAVEAAAFERGQTLKRYVRSAAAMQGLYDDTAIGQAVGRTRIAVGKWWRGARPEPEAVRALSEATGLPTDELVAFIYYDGPPPHLPDPAERAEGEARGQEAERALRPDADSGSRATPHAPRGTAGSGR